MNKIGIMQGRVLPDSTEKLQVFPKKWKEELLVIKKLGFDCLELLDDKKFSFRMVLKEENSRLFSKINSGGLECGSVCMDHLCDYSLLKNERLFFEKIDELVDEIKERNFIFIIPFFDENKLSGKEELNPALRKLSKYENSLGSNKLSLEIDLPAEAIKKELDKFNFRNIGICYDTGSRIGQGADLKKEIELLSDYINHVHIKYKEGGENIRIKKNFFKLEKAFSSLKKINYKGLMILETCIKPIPEEEARINLATVREYVNKKI